MEKRRKRRGERKGETKQKSSVNTWCSGHKQALLYKDEELQYLDVGAWEDPHPAVVLSFVPVLIDLLINVNDVSLLQRKLPVDRGPWNMSRCLNMCKIKALHFLAKGASSEVTNDRRGGSIFRSENLTVQEIVSHLAFSQSFGGWMLTFKLTTTAKCSEALSVCCFVSVCFCECHLMLRIFM